MRIISTIVLLMIMSAFMTVEADTNFNYNDNKNLSGDGACSVGGEGLCSIKCPIGVVASCYQLEGVAICECIPQDIFKEQRLGRVENKMREKPKKTKRAKKPKKTKKE